MMINTMENTLLMSYHGSLNIHVVSALGRHLHENERIRPLLAKKLYKVFIELAQNVSYYSARQEVCDNALFNGIGTVVIREWNDRYTITSENPIRPEHKEKLEVHCKGINQADRNTLRQLKRFTRNHEEGHDQGAHIGLMQIGLLTENPLEYSFGSFDEHTPSFTITATIKKIAMN